MAQHDYDIANGSGSAVRSDINSALQAILTSNSGATAPAVTAPFQPWFDTVAGVLKMRNAANTAWIDASQAILGNSIQPGRNKIINGKMEIAQRGTSFAAIGAGVYAMDRWRFSSNLTGAVLTASQQTDVPSGNEFLNSLRLAVTTADTSIAASEQVSIAQRIEGFNARDLVGRTFTLSFWVRSSKTGVHCVSLGNSGGDRSYVAEYSITAANTWEYKTITVTGGLITTGTWDWTNGIGLSVTWALAAGSAVQTTAGAWQIGNFLATANQVNCLDTVGNILAITGVQLEVGSVATPFEHRPYGAEFSLCQRYYQIKNHVVSTGSANSTVHLPTVMRAAPTIGTVVFDSGTGATFSAFSNTDAVYQVANHSAGPVRAQIPLSAEL